MKELQDSLLKTIYGGCAVGPCNPVPPEIPTTIGDEIIRIIKGEASKIAKLSSFEAIKK